MKKLVCIFLSLLFAFSTLPLCAFAADVPFDYVVYPEQPTYATGDSIHIRVDVQKTALAELTDLRIWVDYPLTDYYLTPGATERFLDNCEASTSQTLRVEEDPGVLAFCAKWERIPLARRILLWAAHAYKSLTLAYTTVQYNLQNGFVSPRQAKLCLGTTTVLYEGTEIPFTVYCRYTAKYAVRNEGSKLSGEHGRATAQVQAVKNSYTGLTFAMEDGDNFGLFAINPDAGKAFLYRVQDGKYTMIGSKTVRIRAGESYPMEVLFENNRVLCTLRDNPKDASPYPVLDLAYDSEATGYGVYAQKGGYADFAVTPDTIATPEATYQNPVKENAPDPFILKEGDTYYLYATTAPNDGFWVSTSMDLIHWTDLGFCARKGDIYGNGMFWAPEVYNYKGKYYLLYSTDEHLALAVADAPTGPFHKTADDYLLPDKCIDGNLLFDEDGTIYLYMAYWGKTGEEVWGCRMSDDLLHIDRSTLTKLTTTQKGEGRINEGPFMLKHEGKYYLTYSINGYGEHKYAVRLAVGDAPLGKYTGREVILEQSGPLVGTGHHCFTTSPDGSELVIAYHCHYSTTQIHGRRLCVDRARFVETEDGPTISVYGPTATPQPIFQ